MPHIDPEEERILARFLDGEGRVKQYPSKQTPRMLVLNYLADKFDYDTDYTEHEVNAILASWHTFEDLFILRRSLVEAGLLGRLRDGSRYWREKKEDAAQ